MAASAHEDEWSEWMRAGIADDTSAYHRFLCDVTPYFRALARRGMARAGIGNVDVEDVVQEVLLAIHLKRHTWDQTRPIGPWISTIARNKIIDCLRRRGRRVEIPIDDVLETLAAEETQAEPDQGEIDKLLVSLNDRQRDIVRSLSLEGSSIRQTAQRLNMTEVAVRVTLHRSLKLLANRTRSLTP